MTPGARVAAAIEILDEIIAGASAEQTLTRWARGHRFAGSKDRAAIRDHVFDVLRRWRSAAHQGCGETGRALMIGKLRLDGAVLDALFSGEGHAPAPLTHAERTGPSNGAERGVHWDLPDWLCDAFADSLGGAAQATAETLKSRAPVTLRVNLARTERADVIAQLAKEGIICAENPLSSGAVTVTQNERRLRQTPLYSDGLIEFQDASSQAVVDAMPQGGRVLDFCAGGGGKALALAARDNTQVTAHDRDAARMKDLDPRADRAGVYIQTVAPGQASTLDPFDVVMVDAPCSGSGAWRRAPEGKWRLTPDRLTELTEIQDRILDTARDCVRGTGTLVYATCSVLRIENDARVDAFLARNPGWRCRFLQQYGVTGDGDGFFTAHLTRTG